MSPALALLLTLSLNATPTLRVALSRSAAELRLAAEIRAEPGGRVLGPAILTARDGQIQSAGATLGPRLTLIPVRSPLPVEIRRRAGRTAPLDSYPGVLLVEARAERLVVVNQTSLEEYLRGVVPLEIGSGGGPAALAAQAIAARSFALARRGDGTRPGADFDVASTQAYRGLGPAKPATDTAVRATAERFLVCDDQPVEAVYSHCCGGVMAAGETAWNAPMPGTAPSYDTTPPGPVNLFGPALLAFLAEPSGWCRADPMNRWRREWDWPELVGRLTPRLAALPGRPDLGAVTGLQITARGPSGRAMRMTISGTQGTVELRHDTAIRGFLGDEQGSLPSTLFVLQREGGRLLVRGGGHGHGVGLCQSGALAMAAAGHDTEAILRHYYPAAQVR